MRTRWYMLIPVGVVWFAAYYFVFRWAILKYNLLTPGREDVGEDADDEVSVSGNLKDYNATRILAALGGKENIVSLENCITRLRLTLKDAAIINEKVLKNSGALAVVRLSGNSIQVVIGPQVHLIKSQLDRLIEGGK